MIDAIRARCRLNGGKKWKGFRIGEEGILLVRIRRNANTHFFLGVVDVIDTTNDYGRIRVNDPKHKKEQGVAIRYNAKSFQLFF